MDEEVDSEFNTKYSPLTNRMMRLLSENSRMSVTDIASSLSIHRKDAERRLRAIESEFGLCYTLELNQSRIGLKSPHLVGVKLGEGVDIERVMRELRRFYVPQVVFATKGKYDLVIYANAFSKAEYASWDRAMRRRLTVGGEMRWDTSEITFRRFGFFPLTSRTIDLAWLPERQKAMLKLLNDNSRMTIAEIAEKMDMNYKTAVYSFKELLKTGYISRFTTLVPMRKEISVMAVFIKYLGMREDANIGINSSKIFTSDAENPLVSRYLIKASLLGAYDSFFMGAFDSMRKAVRYGLGAYRTRMRDIAKDRIVELGVREVLLGGLPIRNLNLKKEYKEHRSGLVSAHDTDENVG